MTAATLTRRWRALRPRARAGLTLLTLAGLIGGWAVLAWLYEPWAVRATLKTPVDTWPLAFSPDGRDFLTSGEGGITRWDVATGDKEGEPWAIPGGESAFHGEFSADGRSFAAICATRGQTITINLFDARTGRVRWSHPVPFRTGWGLRFVDNGESLRGFLGDVTKPGVAMTAITWDAATGRELTNRTLKVPIKSTIGMISADGRTLALGPAGKVAAEVWDLEADRSLGSMMKPSATSIVHWGGIGLSGDGRTLAVGREDGSLELWDVPTQTLKATHSVGLRLSLIRFSPDGRTLAANADPVREGSTVAQIQLAFQQLIGQIRRDLGDIIVLDIATGRRLARASNAFHPHYSPDGRTIATRQSDLSVKLRDVPDPAPVKGK